MSHRIFPFSFDSNSLEHWGQVSRVICSRTNSVLGSVLAKTEVEPATQSHHGCQVDPELVLLLTHNFYLLFGKFTLGLRHHPSSLHLVLVWPCLWWWWRSTGLKVLGLASHCRLLFKQMYYLFWVLFLLRLLTGVLWLWSGI